MIIVHGTDRDADDYLCCADTSARIYFGANVRRQRVMVIAPQFLIASDHHQGNVYWDDNEDWKGGDPSTAQEHPRISSFTVLDQMVANFANRQLFPNLQLLVVAGHSAGGQVVQRYALATPITVPAPVHLRFAPANPSTYAYLSSTRVVGIWNATSKPGCDYCANPDSFAHQTFSYQTPTDRTLIPCIHDYNLWKYGLTSLNEYCHAVGASNMIKQYAPRDVVYLLGGADVCNEEFTCIGCDDHALAKGCVAYTQGLCRRQRGWIFFRHTEAFYKTAGTPFVHKVVEVPGVGHDRVGMLENEIALDALWPLPHN
jgi:pimeloyl-ACP methyl ester carboxylesterase